MKLYTNPVSPNCRKPVAVAKHLGIELEEVNIDLFKGEQKSPDFVAINPNGKVPVLVDGDVILWESNAIMGYLCSKVESTDLWPKSNTRYDIMRWLFWESQHFTPTTGDLVFEALIKPRLGLGDSDPEKIATGQEKFRQHASVLDGHLKDNRYLVGASATLADFAVAAVLGLAAVPTVPVNEFPNVQRWLADLHEMPAWQSTAPKIPG